MKEDNGTYRYPGLKPFDEEHKDVFFGRNEDIKQLIRLIQTKNTILLFSKSGMGKTSLIRAGLLPQLTNLSKQEKNQSKFIIVNIRFRVYDKDSDSNVKPLVSSINSIKEVFQNTIKEKENYSFLKGQLHPNNLWLLLKEFQLQYFKQHERLPKFLFIIDQLEELFTYPFDEIKEWKSSFSDLIYTDIPQQIIEHIYINKNKIPKETLNLLYSSLNIKLLTAIRTDRSDLMHQLDQITDYLPDILNNRYELKPLNIDQVKEAIILPASYDKIEFNTHPFYFHEDAINKILENLTKENPQSIKTFLIQVICQHIEKKVKKQQVENQQNKNERIKVMPNDFDDLEIIWQQYYNNIIDELPLKKREKTRLFIEKHLVQYERRISLDELVCRRHVSLETLQHLANNRLLNRERNNVGGYSYELSHDTLVQPILEYYEKRKQKESNLALQKLLEKEKIKSKKVLEEERKAWAQKTAKRKERRRRIYVIIGIIVTMLGLGIYSTIVRKKNKTIEKAFKDLEKKEKETKMALYKAKESDSLKQIEIQKALYEKSRANQKAKEAQKNDSLAQIEKRKALYEKLRADEKALEAQISDSLAQIEKKLANKAKDRAKIASDSAKKQAIISKTLLLISTAKILLIEEKYTVALRVIQKAYNNIMSDSIMKANDFLRVPTFKVISNVFYNAKAFHKLKVKYDTEINSMIFAPGGKTVLTTGINDSKAIIWDSMGNKIKSLDEHFDYITSIACAPDGDSYLTGGEDGLAILWDIGGTPIKYFRQNTAIAITSMAFSPNNKTILIGGADNNASLWDINGPNLLNDEPIKLFKKHTSDITSIAFSQDSNKILTGSADQTAILWDISGPDSIANPITNFVNHFAPITSVAYSPNGNSILTGAVDNSAILWNIPEVNENGKPDKYFFIDNPYFFRTIIYSPDGKNILTGTTNGKAILWDLNGKQIYSLEGHHAESEVIALGFTSDNKNILTGSTDNTSIEWILEGVGFNTNKKINLREHTDFINAITFTNDGKNFITGSADNTVILWSLNGNVIKTLKGHKREINALSVDASGRYILTGGNDNLAILWDLQENDSIPLPHNSPVRSVAFSNDTSNTLMTGSLNSTKLWDLKGKELKSSDGPVSDNVVVSFVSNKKYILTTNRISYPDSAVAQLWDINDTLIQTFKKHVLDITSLAIGPKGNYFLTGSEDQTAILWDSIGNPIRTLKGHTAQITSVTFSPDAKYILTGSSDKTAKLWDINGDLIQTYNEHTDEILSVAFSPDGNSILTTGWDGTAILWKTPKGIIEWLKTAPVRHLDKEELKEYGLDY